MKKINCFLVSALAMILGPAIVAVGLEMPKEIPNVSLGMTVQELKQARPGAWYTASKLPLNPEKLKSAKFMAMEDLPLSGDFVTAGYGIEGGKVTTITLIGPSPSGKEQQLRRRVVKDSIERWGKNFSRRTPADDSRPGTAQPTLTWEADSVEVVLTLPRTRKKTDKRPYQIGIVLRPASAKKTHPLKDMPMNNSERKEFFKAHDVDE